MSADSTDKDPPVGTRIGGFTIERVLGEGGMGKVYCARTIDGQRVALKVIKARYAHDSIFRRRFAREASIAQRVHHPNVVPVLATGEEAGVPYMAQRYVDGVALAEKLGRDGPLSVGQAVRICADVASGLEALWTVNMVHRDVKPANILIDAKRAYITDFGLAKADHGSVLTLPGKTVGSVDYMAPEQIRGEPVGPATDIYALGCVMYECLCGQPPFSGVQGMRILWAHLQDDPPHPAARRPDLSAGFSRALLRALAKDAAMRPSSAIAYATALAHTADLDGSHG